MERVIVASLLLFLTGCAAFPVAEATATHPIQLTAVLVPSCLFICTGNVSAIREDLQSNGTAAVTSGAKSNTQTTTASGGSRSTTVSN